MTENNRFVDNGFEAIEDQSFMDNLTQKTYYVVYFDEIIELCNNLWKQTKRFEKHNKDLIDENEQLKQYIKNNYMGSVCDNCEHCKEIHTNDWFNGIVHDAECEKGHIDMDISDCEDFKLTSKVFGND